MAWGNGKTDLEELLEDTLGSLGITLSDPYVPYQESYFCFRRDVKEGNVTVEHSKRFHGNFSCEDLTLKGGNPLGEVSFSVKDKWLVGNSGWTDFAELYAKKFGKEVHKLSSYKEAAGLACYALTSYQSESKEVKK